VAPIGCPKRASGSRIDPFLTTLDAKRSLYSAEQSLLATRLVSETNVVELHRSFGGGPR
jgi:multidrug efflux system outer membrane protein